jgi:hypothetical protein
LNPVADAVVIVLCLNESNGQIRLVIKGFNLRT